MGGRRAQQLGGALAHRASYYRLGWAKPRSNTWGAATLPPGKSLQREFLVLARWPAHSQGSFHSFELEAPDIYIPPRGARSALPTRLLRSALRLVRKAVATTPAPPDSPGPGGKPARPHPEPPFVSPPLPGCHPTHPGCTRPCRQRQPAAPSHEHCGAPRVCNAERRLRAARAGSAAGEGGRERGGRDARGGGGRAPLPLAPGLEGRRANQRVQEEPSPLRDAFIGLARATQL